MKEGISGTILTSCAYGNVGIPVIIYWTRIDIYDKFRTFQFGHSLRQAIILAPLMAECFTGDFSNQNESQILCLMCYRK